MVNKNNLISSIEKYYLNGIVESVKWNIVDGTINVSFVSPNQDLIGTMKYGIELENDIIGVFNTSALLKMIGILDSDIIVSVEKQHKIPMKLLIEDKNFSLQYSLANPSVIQNVPEIYEPEFDTTFPIDVEFISRFTKAKSALGSNTKDIVRISNRLNDMKNNEVKLVLGEPTSHSNKIEFTSGAKFYKPSTEDIPFNSLHIREILVSNKDGLKEGTGYLSSEGLLKLEFKTETGDSVYYLPKLQIS